MEELKNKMNQVKEQQKSIVVKSFTNAEAFDLGSYIYEKALKEGKPVAISVTRNRQKLFYAATEGTTVENDHWVMRKENAVYFFNKPTFETGLYMQIRNDNIWDKYGLERGEYSQNGGCIPIMAEGFGMIGTATVSGMSQAEDHIFVTEAVLEWISKQ
ncbi:MAG: heme-binding protein [Eubacteriales bacterium]|nr:heme-binding protein [Eubacteriales bacterium]